MNTRLSRSPMIHALKVNSTNFAKMKNGIKRFVVCFADRDFRGEDLLIVQEYRNGQSGHPKNTGDSIERKIIYVLRKSKGLRTGYVVLGLDS